MDISVTRVRTTGDDLIADAARSSFNRQSFMYTPEQNQKLLNFLAHASPPHWVPFAHVRIRIKVNSPNFAQLMMRDDLRAGLKVAHLTGADYLLTHSIWGWSRMLKAGVFTDQTDSIICAILALPNLEQTVKALNLEAEFEADGHVAEYARDSITLRIECPIVIARHLFKHQLGFAYSEASGRYIDYDKIHYPHGWCNRPANRKQGAGEQVGFLRFVVATILTEMSYGVSRFVYWTLRKMLRLAPEQARFCMPLGTSTTFVVTAHPEDWNRMFEHRLFGTGAQQEAELIVSEIYEEIHGEMS